jgi:hypothetical protein
MHHRRRLPARLRGNEPRIIDEPRTDPRRSKGLSRGFITPPVFLARGQLAHSAELRRPNAMARPGCAVEVNHKQATPWAFAFAYGAASWAHSGFVPPVRAFRPVLPSPHPPECSNWRKTGSLHPKPNTQ